MGGTFQVLNVTEDVLVLLVEYLSDDEGGGRRDAVFGLDHVFNSGFEGFLIGGLFSFHRVHPLGRFQGRQPLFLSCVVRCLFVFS